MKRIGLLSDTHNYWDPRYVKYFESCDEIWHAGDIGSMELADRLSALKPFRAVCGNADGGDLRKVYRPSIRFFCEEVEVYMTHIGGYPGRYDAQVQKELFVHTPQLFISGHSHILKVKYDRTLKMLHINPGAAGMQGWHKVRTLVRFTIDKKEIKDLEVVEMGDNGGALLI